MTPNTDEGTNSQQSVFVEPPSPLDKLLTPHDEAEGSALDIDIAIEEATASCMKQQGHPYQTVDMRQFHEDNFTPEFASLPPDEFGRKYGYGIALSSKLALEPVAVEYEDPNEDYVAGLTTSGRQAYQADLNSCTLHGQQQVLGTTGTHTDGEEELLEWLSEALSELEHRIRSDPSVMQATSAWSRCMAPFGFEFEEPAQMESQLVAEAQNLVAGLKDDVGSKVEKLDELMDKEVRIYVADSTCRGPYTAELAKVREEYETEFIRENGDRLAAVMSLTES